MLASTVSILFVLNTESFQPSTRLISNCVVASATTPYTNNRKAICCTGIGESKGPEEINKKAEHNDSF